MKGEQQVTQEQLNTVCETNEFILFFLRILNKKRASLININNNSFEFYEKIMKQALVKISSDETEQKDPEQYFEIIEYVMILSQTFYAPNEKGERILLQDIIRKLPFWHNKKVWINTIKYHITMEKEKQKIIEEKNYSIREEKEKTIASSAFTTYYFNMNAFDIEHDIKENVKNEIKDFYKIPTDIIDALNDK